MAIKSRLRLNQIQDEVADLAVGGTHVNSTTTDAANLQHVLLNLSNYLERRFGIDKLSGAQGAAQKYSNLFAEEQDEGGAIVYATDRAADLVIRHNASGQAIDIDAAGTIDMDSVGVLNAASAAAGDSAGDTGQIANNAVYIQASAGGIGLDSSSDMNLLAGSDFFLDATDSINLETSGGSIVAGSELADEQSITFGESGSVLFQLSKSASGADEKIKMSSQGSGTAAAVASHSDAAIAITSAGGFSVSAAENYAAFASGDMHVESSAGDIFVGETAASTKKIQLGESTIAELGHVQLTRAATAANSTINVSSQGKALLKSIANTSTVDPSTPGSAALAVHAVAGGVGIESEMADGMAIVLNASQGGIQAYSNIATSWDLADSADGNEEASLYLEASGAVYLASTASDAENGSMLFKAGGAATTAGTVEALNASYGSDELATVIDELASATQPDLMCFDDANRSGWSFKDGIPLSLHSGDWTDFEDAFGEVSLLRALVLSGAGASDAFYHEIEIATAVSSGDDVYSGTLADDLANTNNGDIIISDNEELIVTAVPTISSSTDLAELKDRVEVYVNGQRMALRGDCDVTIDAGNSAFELAFDFDLEIGDVIVVKC